MSDLELLKRFLQNEIDTGSHKIFVFDKNYNVIEFKVVNALNEINDLQEEIINQSHKINRAIEILECSKNMFSERALDILKGEDKE